MAASGRTVNAATSARKTKKVLERLEQKIQEGSYYEALQTCRALYERYCVQGNEEQAVTLLVEGASTLLKHEQYESGTDLALLLVTHLKNKCSPITEDTLDMICKLFVLYKPQSLPPGGGGAGGGCGRSKKDSAGTAPPTDGVLPREVDPREVFMRAALKWTSMVGGEGCKYGHPHLHKLLAISYWECKQYGRAREHFQYACQPEDYAIMLVEVSTSYGHPMEADLFLAQAVLQLLVLHNRRSALAVFTTYTQTHPAFRAREGPPYDGGALLNFVWFLLLSTESGEGDVFRFLRSKYSNVLSRDPCFSEYLDKIGSVFFGVKPTQSTGSNESGVDPNGGGLGGLINSLMGAVTSGGPPAVGEEATPASDGPGALGGLLGNILGGGGGGLPNVPNMQESAPDSRNVPPLGGLLSLLGGGGPGSEDGAGILGSMLSSLTGGSAPTEPNNPTSPSLDSIDAID